MTAPQRPASNSDARKRAEERAAENDAAEVWTDTPDDAPAYQDAYEWTPARVRMVADRNCVCFHAGNNACALHPARVIPPESSAS